MAEKTIIATQMPEAAIEVVSPDGARTVMRVDQNPFFIGRGADTGNHLQLADRRISRVCAAVVFDGKEFRLEDRGQKRGLFINSDKADGRALQDGDTISFGLPDSYELIFRTNVAALPQLLDRMEHVTSSETAAGGLRKLSLLLEAVLQLHSHTPLEQILGNMVDQAIALIDADRGLLLEPVADGTLKTRVARHRGAQNMPGGALLPSQTALRQALTQRRGIVTEDVQLADQNLQAAHSIIAQRLRSVVVIPLFSMGQTRSVMEGDPPVTGQLLGVLYMDSRKPAAFSKLERQILDALAVEAASVLENAKLVENERERERLEREINIARDIQRALLPREFHDYPYFEVTGSNQSCLEVGGDYFDLFDIGGNRTAFVLADVSGKGLGAALMTTMLQGALSATMLGQRPAEMIAHINQFLCEHAQIERYATMFFGVLAADGKMEYINAGHPSPLLLRDGIVSAPFPAECCPVGLIPGMQFTSAEMQLKVGDTMVLFSDGVSEAMDPEQQEYGVDRLKLAVEPRTTAPLEEMQATILDSVRVFARGARQADDVTLLLLRYKAAEKAAVA
ncbi:MAG TPA: SpoIIE family protein phosphatase [Candidatus Acidoferrales bacterium]|nr:SpoIIE family protein phosphatase [Candidatus Acidoferrales bacterium]